jgi:hypothetical protein
VSELDVARIAVGKAKRVLKMDVRRASARELCGASDGAGAGLTFGVRFI